MHWTTTGRPVVSGDICDWLAKEEANAEQWGGLGGAQFYREQFAAARAEIERLRAVLNVIDAQVAAYMNGSIGSSRAIQTISLLLDSEEARRG